MNANRAKKDAEIKLLQERFEEHELFVATRNDGLTVAQSTQLRNDLRNAGAVFKVSKNTLVRRAAKGTQFEALGDMLKGPIGIASSKDAVVAAKIAYEFSKKNEKLAIVGGMLGAQLLDAKAVEALAKLPSLDELRSQLIGLLQAPATKVARVLQAPAQAMVGVTKAYSEKV